MQGGQTKQGELFIALTHEDHKPIIFDRVLESWQLSLVCSQDGDQVIQKRSIQQL